ncbi:MAG TPA: energy transducer TonB [Kofleriaceae bacterium]|nr:energy transducer TonB [Kofleriaceae bacterium]
MRDKLKVYGTSFLVHAAILGCLAYFAIDQVVTREDDEPIEFDIMYLEVESEVEQVRQDPEPPELQPIVAATRPELVPQQVRVVETAKPVPFSERDDDSAREAPDDVEAVPTPVTTMVFDMSSEGGGGGSGSDEYVTTSSDGTIGINAPGSGGAGTGGGQLGTEDRVGTGGVRVARDWQISVMPQPLNDRDFEPDYPPLAKREGREAEVVVQLAVDVTGAVADAQIVSGPQAHGFRQAALAYARKLKFSPARAGQKLVAARIEWTVHFYVRN